MIKLNELIKCINIIAPEDIQEEWDNSGLQVSPYTENIDRILIALEITKDVVEEARSISADMIITHHPLFFNPVKNILIEEAIGAQVISLLEERRIGIYSAHTSFDAAPLGLNEKLASLLEIDVKPIETQRYLRIGDLNSIMSISEVIDKIKSSLNISEQLKYQGELHSIVKKVMLCCGGGGEFISTAKRENCDLYITSDIRQHEWRLAEELGIYLIDAGHYFTERPFAEHFANQLNYVLVSDKHMKQEDADDLLHVSQKIQLPYKVK